MERGGDADRVTPGELLQALRADGPLTRRELADRSALSHTAVGARVSNLLAAGLVAEALDPSTGGRPAGRLAFRPDAGVVLVADLGRTHSRVAVCDLDGTPLADVAADRSLAERPDALLGWVADSFDELLGRTGHRRAAVWGVGIALPGPIELTAAQVVGPSALPGWEGIDLRASLADRFGVPVVVDNDANAEAIGEHWTRWRDEVDDLLYVKCGTGIGCGLVLSGRIHRGALGASGEIGHLTVAGGRGTTCRCGRSGCVQTIASGHALADGLSRPGRRVPDGRAVVALVHAGDAEATRAVRRAGRALGEALGAVVDLLNPAVVIVGGDLADAGDLLLDGVRGGIAKRASLLATRDLRVEASALGDRAGIVGAATTVLDVVLAPAAVDARLAGPTSHRSPARASS